MSNISSEVDNNQVEIALKTNLNNIQSLEFIEELLKNINEFDWYEKQQAKLLLESIIELSQITLKYLD